PFIEWPIALQTRPQCLAIEKIHDEKNEIALRPPIHVEKVHLADVGMRDPVSELDVAPQRERQFVQSRETRAHDLDRDTLRMIRVLQIEGFVDFAHAAHPDTRDDAKATVNEIAVCQ